jgi:hypothetical protein
MYGVTQKTIVAYLCLLNTEAARCSETLVAVYTRLHGVECGTAAQAVIRQSFTAEARIRSVVVGLRPGTGFSPSTWTVCCCQRRSTHTAYSFTCHRRHIISAVGDIVKNNAYSDGVTSRNIMIFIFTAASRNLDKTPVFLFLLGSEAFWKPDEDASSF